MQFFILLAFHFWQQNSNICFVTTTFHLLFCYSVCEIDFTKWSQLLMANIDAHKSKPIVGFFFWSLKCCFAAELQVIVVFSKLFDARSVFVMFLATSANLNGVPSMVSPMALTTFPVNPTLLSQYTGWMFSWILMVDFVVHDFHDFFPFCWITLRLSFEVAIWDLLCFSLESWCERRRLQCWWWLYFV